MEISLERGGLAGLGREQGGAGQKDWSVRFTDRILPQDRTETSRGGSHLAPHGGANLGEILFGKLKSRELVASSDEGWAALRGFPWLSCSSPVCFLSQGWGTLTEAIPAAVAACMPMSVSSKTRQLSDATPSFSAAIRKGCGSGLLRW